MKIRSYQNSTIKEILKESSSCIILNKNKKEILSLVMDGIVKNVNKKINGIPIIINNIECESKYVPELLFYQRSKLVGSLKGIRQVNEIINLIDKLTIY